MNEPVEALHSSISSVVIWHMVSFRTKTTDRPFALRCVVSVGYIYLCRTKHIHFSGLASETAPVPSETLEPETVQIILSKLAKLDQMEQVLNRQQVSVTPAPVPPETASEKSGKLDNIKNSTEKQGTVKEQLARLLSIAPQTTSREAAEILGKPHSTVYRHLKQLKQE